MIMIMTMIIIMIIIVPLARGQPAVSVASAAVQKQHKITKLLFDPRSTHLRPVSCISRQGSRAWCSSRWVWCCSTTWSPAAARLAGPDQVDGSPRRVEKGTRVHRFFVAALPGCWLLPAAVPLRLLPLRRLSVSDVPALQGFGHAASGIRMAPARQGPSAATALPPTSFHRLTEALAWTSTTTGSRGLSRIYRWCPP